MRSFGSINLEVGARRTRTAPIGAYARYVFTNYAAKVFIVCLGLSLLALSFDLGRSLSSILQVHGAQGFLVALRMTLWFVILRLADRLPDILPIAGFLGALWAQIAMTLAGERAAVSALGRSWTGSWPPILAFAVVVAVIHGVAGGVLRQEAAIAQARAGLGEFVPGYARIAQRDIWTTVGPVFLTGRFEAGPPLRIAAPVIYLLDGKGMLQEIISASEMRPEGNSGAWTLLRGTSVAITESEARQGEPFDQRPMNLNIPPYWLAYSHIPSMYMPLRTLLRITSANLPEAMTAEYRARLQANFALPLLSGGLIALAWVLTSLLIDVPLSLTRLLQCGICGYIVHAAGKQLVMLGQHEHLPVALAVWCVPAGLLIGLATIVWVTTNRERRDIDTLHYRSV